MPGVPSFLRRSLASNAQNATLTGCEVINGSLEGFSELLLERFLEFIRELHSVFILLRSIHKCIKECKKVWRLLRGTSLIRSVICSGFISFCSS